MKFDTNPNALWRFRSTGRLAKVVLVRSGKREQVEFRFEGDNTVRRVYVRRFLSDFERIE